MRDRSLVFAVCLFAAALAGCSRNAPPTAPALADVRPALTSPRAVAEAIEWSLEHRGHGEYMSLLAEHFTFGFQGAQSTIQWSIDDERIAMRNMLVDGSSNLPPVDRIEIDWASSIRDFPDSRPGKHPTWHRETRLEMVARISRGQQTIDLRGPALLYFVRGDSAQSFIGGDSPPDTSTWLVDGWEDETVGATPAINWASLKAQYR